MSLSRILAGGTSRPPTLVALSDLLELVTADAIAKNRTNIICLSCKRRALMSNKQSTTAKAEPSLADIVVENIKAKAEAEDTRQDKLQRLEAILDETEALLKPEPEESSDDTPEPPAAA